MEKPVLSQRNKEKTKREILLATRRLIARKGFQGIGINAIAKEAGYDKVLIYRYFGGLAELLQAVADDQDFWPSFKEHVGMDRESAKQLPLYELANRIMQGQLRELRKRPDTQEIFRWRLIERNELSDALDEVREKRIQYFIEPFEDMEGVDVAAMAAILSAGITNLVLNSKTSGRYCTIDLHSEEGWERISKAVSKILHTFLDHEFSHAED